MLLITKSGVVAKLVDALDLGSSGATRESSSLSNPTIYKTCFIAGFLLLVIHHLAITEIAKHDRTDLYPKHQRSTLSS